MPRMLVTDVVIMDVAMPRLNGLEAAKQIRDNKVPSRILILSAHEDDAYLERAIENGVAGYLIKHTSCGMFLDAIRAIAAGKTFFAKNEYYSVKSSCFNRFPG